MARKIKEFSVGQIAARTGLAVSAIHFYETLGLVKPVRTAGGQRRFKPSDIRRLSFVMITQQLGFSLAEIKQQFKTLPDGRTPTQKDWEKFSKKFGQHIDARIDALTLMRQKLNSCIGCGCLSLTKCALYNPNDNAAGFGAGPRYLLGDKP